MSSLLQRMRRLALLSLMFVALVGAPGAALAATGEGLVTATSPVAAATTAASVDAAAACADEQKVSPALLAQAQARLGGEAAVASLADDGTAGNSLFPQGVELGLSTTGQARSVVIRVSFPASADGSEEAQVIPATETDEDLLAIFNGQANASAPNYPYESIYAYYLRSSYGRLDFKATQVVSCTAAHPRSYYEGMGLAALYYEVLAAVDDQVDFSQCDANDDGYIDAVYLQFAGNCGEWASTWWPKKNIYTTAPDGAQDTFDGKKLCAGVLIDTLEAETTRTGKSNPVLSVSRTLIHETGHVLGLPDLYSYTNSTKGTGSIDMMDINLGDQNGLFKWLLGWIDADQITYVYTSSAGVDVRRGTGQTVHYDTSATLDLLPYTTDESWEKTGGFVAVSSDKSILDGNLFCSFHLLVFDQSAANMTLNTTNHTANLGHGVRAFRVRAGLNETKNDFAVSNTTGVPGNQLYECLRPIDGDGASELGDFWHLGGFVSPSTTPSTNYLGSQEAGYTGITFKVVGETDTSAQVEFSWTAQAQKREFTLTPTTATALNGFATFTYSATWTAPLKGSEALSVHMMVDGQEVPTISNYDVATGKMTVAVPVNPGRVVTGSSAELVVDAGLFDLGLDDQGKDCGSSEMHIPVAVPAALTQIEASGNYDQTGVEKSAAQACSDVCVGVDGRAYFFQAAQTSAGQVVRLVRVSEDCSTATATQIELDPAEEYWNDSGLSVQAVDLGDGTAFLQVRAKAAYASGDIAGRDVWVDVASGKVLAARSVDAEEVGAAFFSLGDGHVGYTVTAADYSRQVVVLTRDGAQVTACRVALALPSQVEYIEAAGSAGDGYVMGVQHGRRADGEKATVVLWRAADIVAAADSGAVEAATSFSVADNNRVLDVVVAGEKVYAACETIDRTTSGAFIDELRVYSLGGELESAVTVSPYADAAVALKVSESGAVAWITNVEGVGLASLPVQGRVVIYDPADGGLCEMGVAGPVRGTWMGARWLEIGDDMDAYVDGHFGDLCQHWSLTREFKVAEPEPEPEPKPDPEPEPDPEPGPDPNPTPNTTTTTTTASEKTATKTTATPQTGDTTYDLAALLAASVLLTATALATRRLS